MFLFSRRGKKKKHLWIFYSYFHSMFMISLLCLGSFLCSHVHTLECGCWEWPGSFGIVCCCFSAELVLSVSGWAPGLDVTLKGVQWDTNPTAKVPHLHSCDIARGYSAGQHQHCHHNSRKMASAARSHDDKWQEASCHNRRAHHGSGEGRWQCPKALWHDREKPELQLWQLAPLHPSI